MILIAGNRGSPDQWRNMSCRYHAATVDGLSGASTEEARWNSIDALLDVPGVVFSSNVGVDGGGLASVDGGYPAITPDYSSGGTRLYKGIEANIQDEIDSVQEVGGDRTIGSVNINIEIDPLVQTLWHGGLSLTSTQFDESWFTSPGTTVVNLRSMAELAYWDDEEFGWGLGYDPATTTFATQPTFAQAVQAYTRMHTARAQQVKASGLIASQWWKSRAALPFFRSGWWSGQRPAPTCAVGAVSSSCKTLSAFHTIAGHKLREWSGSSMVVSTGSPDIEATNAWVSGGWAQRASEVYGEMYANCPGMADHADLVPVQFYNLPCAEATVSNHLGSGASGHMSLFYRQDSKNWYLPSDQMVESISLAARNVWRGASAAYGDKACLGLTWMTDFHSGPYFGAWCPPDAFEAILDHAFEPAAKGSIAPKHIAFWSSAGFLSYLFAGTNLGTHKDAARSTVANRFSGRTSVTVDWDGTTTAGKQWRAAIAALFDEDTHERVLIAKRCIERARRKGAATQSTLTVIRDGISTPSSGGGGPVIGGG